MMKKKILTYPLSNKGELSYDLNEKRLTLTHIDFFRDHTYFPFSISHIYQNNNINHGYGKGFNLNLEQTLSKIEGTSKYKLSLPDGSEEIFEEVYYYKDSNDKRVYKTTSGQSLKRSDITLSLDGTLKYNDHLIYVDLKTDTGLTLKSDYKDFIGSDKIELRYEDLATLEEEIKQIDETLEDLEYNKNEYTRFTNEKYTEMLNSQKDLEDVSTVLSEKEVAQFYDSLEGSNTYYDKKEQYLELTKKERASTYGVALRKKIEEGGEVISYVPAFGVSKYMPKNENNRLAVENKQYDYLFEKVQDDKSRFELLTDSAKKGEYYEQVYTNELEKLNNELERLSKTLEDKSRENQLALYHLKQQYNEKNTIYQNAKKTYEDEYNKILKDYYDKLVTRTDLQIQSYRNLKSSKEYQRDEVLKQIPELYLSSEDGIIYGYNTYGKLCVLFDAYHHQAVIEYNDRNQIKEIVDDKQHKIQFVYDGNNQLIRMMDDENEFVDFIYENEFLTQIHYSNENQFTLKYIQGNLTEVLDIDSLGYQFEYANFLLSSIQSMSYVNEAYCLDEKISFLYTDHQIIVSNSKNRIVNHYLFDEENSLTTEYNEKEDKLDSIQTYEFGSSHCSFSMSSSKHDQKLVEIEHTSVSGEQMFNVNPLNSYTFDTILYAFVQADSVDEIRKRRITAYCNHLYGDQNTGVHFELKCLLKYSTYQKEFSVSFDPKIKGKQFAAIPITFDEDSNGQVILPSEITVGIDYQGNQGQCEVNYLTLAQGEYTYCEYDEAHHKVFECFSEAVSVKNELLEKKGHIVQKKEIEYQYNPKDLLEHEISRIYYEEYDIDDMLLQRKQKEESVTYHYNHQNKIIKEFDSKGNVVEYLYNEEGNCVQKKNYRNCMPNMAYIEDVEYDENGKIHAQTNPLGYKETYQYQSHTPISLTTPNGNILYMNTSVTSTSISSDIDGIGNYNTCIYEKGRLSVYETEGMRYHYTYDEFGREKELYINDELYCSFSQTKTTTNISYITLYNNKTGYEKITDLYGKVLKINQINNNQIKPYISYDYDTKDRLISETHYINHKEEKVEYLYLEDTLVGIRTHQYVKTTENDLLGYSKKVNYQKGDNTYQYEYTYDEENRLDQSKYSINGTNPFIERYRYDALNRIKETQTFLIKNRYSYLTTNGRTTDLISTNQKQIGSHHQNYTYRYDKEGNITNKLENHKTTRYAYDSLQRLIREDNESLNQTILYTYDSNGNIQSKELYTYTLTDNLENKEIIEYNYSDFNDYLTQFNGREIKYDSIGNPILYKGISLQWNQKELTQYGDIEFKYDVNHIRTRKKTPDTEIEYIVDGTRILKEKRKHYTTHLESIIDEYSTIDTYEEEIEYIYSPEGIIGFDHIKAGQRKRYFYNKNILGDIIEIYDEEGKLVGKYGYDAYGNQNIEFNHNSIATINPFRYRSYYYDTETNLYYLNSRYYDPEVSRFISMDSIEYINPDTLNGLNLYAYCKNNPVMYIDPTGHAPWWSWLISGLQVLGGIALCFVPGVQGIGASLIVGGTLGLISNAVSPAIAQAIGGASSIANGAGAFTTGMSILGLGIPGLIGGVALMLVGAATMAFGANEVVAAATGTNYIQQWTGMSDAAYGWTYFGLNLASSVGQIAANIYYLQINRLPRLGYDGKPNGYRYKTPNGKMYDFDYPHGNVKKNHFHGIPGGDLKNRTSGHWNYFRLIWWLISGR